MHREPENDLNEQRRDELAKREEFVHEQLLPKCAAAKPPVLAMRAAANVRRRSAPCVGESLPLLAEDRQLNEIHFGTHD